MADIKSILFFFTKSTVLSLENLSLARKTALLELKFSKDSFLSIEGKNYSKDDLVKLFDYYEDEKKRLIFLELENLPDIEIIQNLNLIGRFSQIPPDFEQNDNYRQIIEFVSLNYGEQFFKKVVDLYKSKSDYHLRKIIYLFSFLPYFTQTFQNKIKIHLKNTILSEISTIQLGGKKLPSKYTYQDLFLFKINFVQICGLVGNDDEEFISFVLNTTIDIYNNYKKKPELLVASMRAHKKLNHNYDNQFVIDENIRIFEKIDKDYEGYNPLKMILYILIFFGTFFFRIPKSCSDNRQSNPNYNNYSYPNILDKQSNQDSIITLQNGKKLNFEAIRRKLNNKMEQNQKLDSLKLGY